MGDITDAHVDQSASETTENPTCDVPKESTDNVKEVKSSENISIETSKQDTRESDVKDPVKTTKGTTEDLPLVSVETVFKTTESTVSSEENKGKNTVAEKNINTLSDKLENKTIQQDKKDSEKEEAVLKQKERNILKNKSDIFSAPDGNLPSTIFSVRGAPAKTIHKTDSTTPEKETGSNCTISSSQGSLNSRKTHLDRNPLTGIGVNSNDEFKIKPSKRKDGNPLLGVGYKDDEQVLNPQPSQRIPPGGYSQGLW